MVTKPFISDNLFSCWIGDEKKPIFLYQPPLFTNHLFNHNHNHDTIHIIDGRIIWTTWYSVDRMVEITDHRSQITDQRSG